MFEAQLAGNLYYIYCGTPILTRDREIAQFMNIPLEKYREILTSNFKAYIVTRNNSQHGHYTQSKECYFTNEEDAIEAIEWLNSKMLMEDIINKQKYGG